MNYPLPATAEVLRKRIKEMIPETRPADSKSPVATILAEDDNGSTRYGGKELHNLVSGLVKEMNIGRGWGWNLGHFRESQPIINDLSRMYIVPLCDNTSITPGGPLREGFYTYITDSPSVSSNATAIFIAPI
ncbi:hypothetical protein BDV37DRAFT_277368 [Aspergillus pseudonomiae]|uniref:Uncharacterized protein n=1 Tax=Aspergillus pseudonomiae TaxID=1506151 RepID=A0A5N7CSZ8_9EURO|nr:uncharacterized protein BDV37DRAFT_277368 [Aspergillus pseudonomiae]KAE8396807.1 hypothetical protein BDV37DRAFT_277368 [Aspergillus pseudonomiae]